MKLPDDASGFRFSTQATMEVHWGKHHRTYVDNLNKQLEGKPLADKPIEEVRKDPREISHELEDQHQWQGLQICR